jgi:hypothetical protein
MGKAWDLIRKKQKETRYQKNKEPNIKPRFFGHKAKLTTDDYHLTGINSPFNHESVRFFFGQECRVIYY